MTYGVDQCRMCGVPIQPYNDKPLREWQKAQLQRPTMPEAEWRRQGFLAMPTKAQLHSPTRGCCRKCGLKAAQRSNKPFLRMALVLTVMFILLVVAALIFVTVPR